MEDTASILEKVKKLLKLSGNNPNPNEAARAAAKAQELILRYKLDAAAINPNAADETVLGCDANPKMGEVNKFTAGWKGRLAVVVAKHNSCLAVLDHDGKGLRIIGTKSNAANAVYLFQYLSVEIERLCMEAVCFSDLPLQTQVERNSFKTGCVEGVATKLEEMRKSVETEFAGTEALVFVGREKAALDAYLATQRLGRPRASYAQSDASSRMAGREAGRNISLNTQVGKGRETLKIGSGR